MTAASKIDLSLVRMARRLIAGVGLAACGAGAALGAECFPYCDYVHNYGPYDFTYVRPGLFGYPTCGPRGNCLPNLTYSTSGRVRRGSVEVHFLPRPRYRVPQ